MAHLGEEHRCGRPLDDPAGVHHRDVVGAPGHHPEIVGDEDDGHEPLALLFLEQVEDLRPGR